MTLVAACVENVHNLRTKEKCCHVWDEVVTQINAYSRRTGRDNTLLQDYLLQFTIYDLQDYLLQYITTRLLRYYKTFLFE